MFHFSSASLGFHRALQCCKMSDGMSAWTEGSWLSKVADTEGRRIHLRLGKQVSRGAVGAHKRTVGWAQQGHHALLGKTVRPRPSSYAAWAWRELECALSLRWGPADWYACTTRTLNTHRACTAIWQHVGSRANQLADIEATCSPPARATSIAQQRLVFWASSPLG